MRLSLWQQWSSNHSANFMVVGEFKTSQQAQEAKAKLQRMFGDIVQWAAEHPDKAEQIRENYIGQLTPPEETYRVAFGVGDDWYGSLLEWLLPSVEDDRLEDAACVIDHYLLVEPPVSTWLGHLPIEPILRHWGAGVIRQVESSPWRIRTSLTCVCPEEATADKIHRSLAEQHSHSPRPWLIY